MKVLNEKLHRKLYPRHKVPGVRWIDPEHVVIERTKEAEFIRRTHWSRVGSALESAGWNPSKLYSPGKNGWYLVRRGRQFFWEYLGES